MEDASPINELDHTFKEKEDTTQFYKEIISSMVRKFEKPSEKFVIDLCEKMNEATGIAKIKSDPGEISEDLCDLSDQENIKPAPETDFEPDQSIKSTIKKKKRRRKTRSQIIQSTEDDDEETIDDTDNSKPEKKRKADTNSIDINDGYEQYDTTWHKQKKIAFCNREKNPHNFLYHFAKNPKHHRFSKEEDKLFIEQLKLQDKAPKGSKGAEGWVVFSQRIPGRNGLQCRNHFNNFKKKGIILVDKETQKISFPK
eukprot:gene11030-3736_t